MEELKIAETKGLKDVGVFEVNEYDAVAAYYAEDAVDYYQKEIDDREDACYPIEDVEEVSKEKQILKYENSEETESVAEVINARWEGKPFVVYSSG
ncbi:hypothetical protein [Halobacillus litoralis]|uniref:Uncharacterized protein n=1 Tax=Halobacillus litoralis TaxID=45668 RepID=A0A410MCD9_9BACI|nr:hypothetical protein [Halobacillus litoralis]QAS52399.1 hypothetical protein HLI_09210 [Halobacillus litoralis]